MFNKFQDARAIAEYVCLDLLVRFPSAEVELYLQEKGGGNQSRERGDLRTILRLFVGFCREFPEALVRYEPKHPYGMVSTVLCHCSSPGQGCPEKCCDYSDRPRAFLTLIAAADQDVLVGSKYVTPVTSVFPSASL